MGVIRRKNAQKSLETLKFMNKNGSDELYKMIKNGLSQADEQNLVAENIIIKKVQCDKAKELKRHRFESKGRVARIKKHQHHIFIVLSDEQKNLSEKKAKQLETKKVDSKSESKKEK